MREGKAGFVQRCLKLGITHWVVFGEDETIEEYCAIEDVEL